MSKTARRPRPVKKLDDGLAPWERGPTEFERRAGTGSVDTIRNGRGQVLHRARYWTNSATGVRVRRSVYGKTEAIMLRNLAEALKASTSKGHAKKSLTAFLTDDFLAELKKNPDVRASTYESYRGVIEPRATDGKQKIASIVDDIGSVRVGDFTLANAKAWIESMQGRMKDGRGARTIQVAVRVLKQAYRVAYADPKHGVNPIGNLELPTVKTRKQHILDLSETRRLLAAALASDWGPLFYLAVATSARQGELFGLKWENVDLGAGTADVVQTVTRGYENEPRKLGDPKTESSERTLFLDAGSVRLLKEHRTKQSGPNPMGLVFPSADAITKNGKHAGLRGGGFLSKDNVTGRVLPRLLVAAKIKATRGAIPFHSLRHVGNSLLDAKGVPGSTLQRRLGHSDRTVTQRYTHAADTEQKKAAMIMGTLLAPVLDGRKWVTKGVTTVEPARKPGNRKPAKASSYAGF
jgi:integrase